MALADPIRLPKRLSFADVDSLLAKAVGPEPLTISLISFSRSNLFAEASLLSLLLMAKQIRKPVYVDLELELPAFEASPGHRLWRIFLESLAGLILAQLADGIVDASG